MGSKLPEGFGGIVREIAVGTLIEETSARWLTGVYGGTLRRKT
jgi:hypothetical protein